MNEQDPTIAVVSSDELTRLREENARMKAVVAAAREVTGVDGYSNLYKLMEALKAYDVRGEG